jgi:hypothetical protein
MIKVAYLSHAERDDLLDHLMQATHVWSRAQCGMSTSAWVRSKDQIDHMILKFTDELRSSITLLEAEGAAWDDDLAVNYARGLLTGWTSYNERVRVQQLLHPHVALGFDTRQLAIAITDVFTDRLATLEQTSATAATPPREEKPKLNAHVAALLRAAGRRV